MWKCVECGHDNADTMGLCETCDAPRDPSTFIGLKISHWILEKQLGEGGMAVVFLAKHVVLGSPVAVKLLRADLTQKRDVIERFRTEALAASHLKHENVIQVLDFGHQKGIGFYMVLEFLNGYDLEEKLESQLNEPLDQAWILGVSRQIAAGLQVAHEAGILHRDLKPSNIFLVPRKDSKIPLAKILDFGIAKIQESELQDEQQKLTRTGTVLGTPFYLAPEQLTRRDSSTLGPSVDIYAFGVILFQMFTGHLPIEEPTVAEQMVAILTKRPPMAGSIRPDLADTALEIFLHRMLAKSEKGRPASFQEVLVELEQATGVLEDLEENEALRQQWEVTYRPLLEEPEEEPTFFARWRMVLVPLFVLALLGGGWGLYMAFQPPPKPVVIVKTVKQKLSKLKRLKIEAFKAAEKGDDDKVLALLQRLEKLRKSKKQSKPGEKLAPSDPEVERLWGEIMARKKRIFQAVLRYRQYLKRVKADPKDKKLQDELKLARLKLDQMEAALKRLAKRDKKLQRGLRIALKGKQYKLAHDIFKTLFKDGSYPDPYINAAKVLQNRFPAHALRLYQQANKLPLSQKQKTLVKSKLAQLGESRTTKRKAAMVQLEEHIVNNEKRSAQKALRRMLRDFRDDAALYRDLRKLFQRRVLTRPALVRSLSRILLAHIKRLKKAATWVWLRPLIGKALPAKNEFAQMVKQARTVKSAVKRHERAKKALNAGNIRSLRAAQKIFEKMPEKWDKIAQSPGPWQKMAEKNAKEAKALSEKLKAAIPLYRAAQKAKEEFRFGAARKKFEEFLGHLEEGKAKEKFQAEFRSWERKKLRAQKAWSRARRSFRRKKWVDAKRYYFEHIKLFPRSWRRKRAEKQIDFCNCTLGVSWKECPKKKIRIPRR